MTGHASRESRGRRPPSGGSLFLTCLLAVVFVAVALVGILLAGGQITGSRMQSLGDRLVQVIDEPAAKSGETVLFTVREGETADEIGRRLERARLISDANTFRFLIAYYGVGGDLKAGDYELRPTMTGSEIIARLRGGQVATVQITIPEGWRNAEIVRLLEDRKLFARDAVLDALKSASFNDELLRQRPEGASLEGYLFPDTYSISPRDTPENLIQRMLSNLERRFTPTMREQAKASHLTVHEVLTLASIVEREAVHQTERPLIASVYLNRLRNDMTLDADPTIQYAISFDQLTAGPDIWKRGLSLNDLGIESPYNTYRRRGLPPGPICNPGLASIKAVLEPAQTDFLYFVARGDGTHAFARTLEEHAVNVRRFGL